MYGCFPVMMHSTVVPEIQCQKRDKSG